MDDDQNNICHSFSNSSCFQLRELSSNFQRFVRYNKLNQNHYSTFTIHINDTNGTVENPAV